MATLVKINTFDPFHHLENGHLAPEHGGEVGGLLALHHPHLGELGAVCGAPAQECPPAAGPARWCAGPRLPGQASAGSTLGPITKKMQVRSPRYFFLSYRNKHY